MTPLFGFFGLGIAEIAVLGVIAVLLSGRNTLLGPGLASLDVSLFKTTQLSERWKLQFRAEFFNVLNRANFSFPSLIVLTTSGAPSPSAGLITSTATTSRQIQFGLKLNW